MTEVVRHSLDKAAIDDTERLALALMNASAAWKK